MSHLIQSVCLSVLGLGAGGDGASPAPDRDIASLLPSRSLLMVEAGGLSVLLEEGLDHPFVKTLRGTAFARALLAQANPTPEAALASFDALYGRPVLPTLARLSSRGAALALVPGDPAPRPVVILVGRDAEELERSLDAGFDLVEQHFGFPGALDEPAEEMHGAGVWFLGDDLAIARRGALLVLSNDRRAVREVLALAADSGADGLLANEDFARARKARPKDCFAWGWADLAALERIDAAKLGNLRGMNGQPAVHSLLGPGIAGIGAGASATAWLRIERDELELAFAGLELPEAPSIWPGQGRESETTPAPLGLEQALVEGVVYRDYAALFRDRVDLFPAETLPGFAEAIAGMALFFGGRDVAEEVLPGLSPWIRIVAAPLSYAPDPVPEIPLPGVALVARLDDPEVRGAEVQAAFQTLIGVLNVDQAQKGEGMTMQLRMGLEGETQITSARYLPPREGDGVDMRYNLQPACAVADGSLILGSHEELVRAVVRHLNAGRTGRGPEAPGEHLTIDGPGVARVVAANERTLVMNKVLDEGVSMEKAEGDIQGLRLLLESLRGARIAVDYGDREVRLHANVRIETDAGTDVR